MLIDSDNLAEIFGGSPNYFEEWVAPLNDTMRAYLINTEQRQTHFLCQIGHESNRFNSVSENLNYGAEGLLTTFGKYFPTMQSTIGYVRNPEKIANKVYANRNGNGDEDSGDGWKYRGRGLIQVTGKNNYSACGDFLGVDLINSPDYLKDTRYACFSAGWYWQSNALNTLADLNKLEAITKKINGGLHGLDDRQHLLTLAKKALRI